MSAAAELRLSPCNDDPPAAPPLVSVIVPAYNAAAFIAGAIRSVLRQAFQDFEIIVVNDHSPDTPALERALAPFADQIRYLAREENGGVAAARNTGIRAARGRFVALLDSDDVWEPEYLDEQVRVMEADPRIAVVYSDALIVGDHPHAGRTYMDVCPSNGPVSIQSLLTERCNVFISALVRRESLLRAGLFDETLRSAEDFEMWIRLLAAGERIEYHRKVLVRYLKRPESLSADSIGMAEHALIVLDKMANRLALSADDRAIVTARQAYFRATLQLALGKQAFHHLNTPAALEHLQRANEHFRSPRLWLICALIRTCPRFLVRLYELRDRLLLKANTSL